MIEKIISKAPNLEKFRLGGVLSNTNSTRKISPSFCTLNKLEILELNDNNFGSIPNCFHYTSFPKLTVLDLTGSIRWYSKIDGTTILFYRHIYRNNCIIQC